MHSLYKTSDIPLPASAFPALLSYTLHTMCSTGRYWSGKKEDAGCFFLVAEPYHSRSFPTHTLQCRILSSDIPCKNQHLNYFLTDIYLHLPRSVPWSLFYNAASDLSAAYLIKCQVPEQAKISPLTFLP